MYLNNQIAIETCCTDKDEVCSKDIYMYLQDTIFT